MITVEIRVPEQSNVDKNGNPLRYGFYDADHYNSEGVLVKASGIVSVRNPELFDKFQTGTKVQLDESAS